MAVFTLDEKRYALDVSTIDRVDRIVEITPLPKAPDVVLGVINAHGTIIPVVNIRKRFRLPERELSLSDQMIIAHTQRRAMAIVVDQVIDIMPAPTSAVINGKDVIPGIDYVDGVLKLPDGMVLIHDLDKFLSIPEVRSLEESLGQTETPS